MKRFFALFLILSLLMALAGCTADGDRDASTIGAGDTAGGTVSMPERMISDLTMIYRGYVCEHHFGTDGKLAYTDVRGTDWSYGLYVYQLRYIYDDDGTLLRMDAYGKDDDSLDMFTCTYTLYRTVEFEVTDTGYSGTVYGYDSRGGGRYPTGDTVTAVLENGTVKSADWTGCIVEFDENGRKISERTGDRYAEFVYDDNGSVTQMKIYDAEGEYYTLTVEYGEDGYPDQAWIKNTDEDQQMTFDIDGGGVPIAFYMTESDEDSTYITDVEFTHTEAGDISKLFCRRDRGEYERFFSYDLTYNDAGQPVAQVYESGDGETAAYRSEHTFTFDENGLLTEEYVVCYDIDNGELVPSGEERTVYTYDEQGRVLEKAYVYESSDYRSTSTYTYAYNDAGRIVLDDSVSAWSDRDDISHVTTTYEYHENGTRETYTCLYYDITDQPEAKFVTEYDECEEIIATMEYTYESGEEVLNTVTRYTILSRETTNGETTTITEEITYDGNDQPLEKIITERVVDAYSGSEQMIARYLYENGEWMEQELW